MFLVNRNMINESASAGEELLMGSPLSEIVRKRFVVKQVVPDGDFPLEQALELCSARFPELILIILSQNICFQSCWQQPRHFIEIENYYKP